MSHTPGPWHVVIEDTIHEEAAAFRVDAGLGNIALVNTVLSAGKADATLIAAAPDLLAALQELQKKLREHIKMDVKKHYSLMVADAAANTAIAKAKGE